MGPECHHKCLYKIEAKGVIEGGKEEVKTEPKKAGSLLSKMKGWGCKRGMSGRR